MSDIQSQIDDITSRIDENDGSLNDLADNTSASLQDVQGTLDDHTTSLDTLNESSGQLTFPLSQDTIDLITEQGPTILQVLNKNNYIGTATLAAGTVTVTTNLVSATSLIMLSAQTAGGTQGDLSYTSTSGSFTITSSNAADTSTIIYFILSS